MSWLSWSKLKLLGCQHERLSFPIITSQDRHRGGAVMPHVTCLDCGSEFRYDWDRMHRSHDRLPSTDCLEARPKRSAA